MTSNSRSLPRLRRLALLAAVVVCAAAAALELQITTAQAQSGYTPARDRLLTDLSSAEAQGYTGPELAPVPASARRLATADPVWVSARPGYYGERAAALAALDARLHELESSALASRRRAAVATVQAAARGVADATEAGADPFALVSLHQQLARTEDDELAATEPRQLALVVRQASAVRQAAVELSHAQAADLAAIQAAAAAMPAGDPARLRADAQRELAGGRNDAAVAAFLRLGVVTGPYDQLERYGAMLEAAGSDHDRLTLADSGLQHYREAIHAALLGALPRQAIVVSHQAQELWAYEDGKLLRDALVTTGRAELPTDIGVMKVLSKSSPFTMRSPWPKTSPWWYPDTKVQMVLWFTVTGEGLHDAGWEWESAYGPGSEYGGFASHGCIHVPLDTERWLYGWAKVGTPVIVFPGDGSPVADQVAQISVDADGNPTTGPKGV